MVDALAHRNYRKRPTMRTSEFGLGAALAPDHPRWLLKPALAKEEQALAAIHRCDKARLVTQGFKGVHTMPDNRRFLVLENLGLGHEDWIAVDIKMGTHGYNPLGEPKIDTPRRDLLKKLLLVAPHEVTAEEKLRGVTKRRYQDFRDNATTTRRLGYRIETVRYEHGDASIEGKFNKYKHSDSTADARRVMDELTRGSALIRGEVIERLEFMHAQFSESAFMASHCVVGSSVTIYVGRTTVSVLACDFGKVTATQKPVDRRSDVPRPADDGFMLGLRNLIETVGTVPEALALPAKVTNQRRSTATEFPAAATLHQPPPQPQSRSSSLGGDQQVGQRSSMPPPGSTCSDFTENTTASVEITLESASDSDDTDASREESGQVVPRRQRGDESCMDESCTGRRPRLSMFAFGPPPPPSDGVGGVGISLDGEDGHPVGDGDGVEDEGPSLNVRSRRMSAFAASHSLSSRPRLSHLDL